jgi:hypothetical protein
MAIDERARHQLYLRLEEHLGAEAATTLMEHLPPTGWADVATKRDLDQFRAVTKADLDQFRAVTKADLDQFRAVTEVRFGELRAEIKAEVGSLRAELHKTIATHTVLIVFATMATSIASVFAAAQLR